MDNADKYRQEHDHGGIERQKQGVSSFDAIDSALAFRELRLKKGDFFLDLGCGAGDYAIQAAKIIGDSGKAYAFDKWKEVVAKLAEKARAQGLNNIEAIDVDIITSSLPLKDKSIDVCLIAQVLHGLSLSKDTKTMFTEIRRVLKTGGRLAIIDFKKEDCGFGPPLEIRLLPREVEDMMTKYGFKKTGLADLGCSYMIQFLA
jgi:ubiquinone/menaquinone biosynthesis C-methylase UbiE